MVPLLSPCMLMTKVVWLTLFCVVTLPCEPGMASTTRVPNCRSENSGLREKTDWAVSAAWFACTAYSLTPYTGMVFPVTLSKSVPPARTFGTFLRLA
jgi:hypothetical protein